MTTDGELLGHYCEGGSEEAFGELVRRHLDLVYSAALRQVNGNAPLAQDVAQSVFCDLARKAAALKNHSTVAGWLYTSTHHAAANAVRSELRRHTHEQEAHAMQELIRNSGPEFDWESFRPMLDDAMQELNEGDREVILLRYFQNRTYPDIGEQIGVGENGARMKAERALEKLRGVLSRRGLATTGAVATLLSTHAVSAAPAGLAGTITSAAAVAGAAATATAASTATIAVKTITMTTLSKVIAAAVIAAAIGTAIYTGSRASQLGKENRVLRQQQAALNGQIQDLQQQQSEASNRLALLTEENHRLASGQNTSELLKLRGQVTALKQSASSASSGGNTSSTSLAKMMNDPAMREYIHQKQLQDIRERYAGLINVLKLSPEDAEKFNSLMSEIRMKGTDLAASGELSDPSQQNAITNAFAGLYDQLHTLLGDAGLAQLRDYDKTMPGRTLVQSLNQQLDSKNLTDEQNAQLLQVVSQQSLSSTRGIAGEIDSALFGSQETIDAHWQQVMDSNQRILDQSASFLTSNQLWTLATVLSNSVDAQKNQAFLAQKH
jgi:RNA polymerase sigma factor (sigma-70 family)